MTPDSAIADKWIEEYLVVPADDGKSVLVFSEYFVGEGRDGETEFDQEHRSVFESENHLRLADVARIHQRLLEGADDHEESSRRIVQYLGASPAGYRLERLSPGPFPQISPNVEESDALLALYQRWAMQYLCACRYVHAKGVIIASPPHSVIWLRPDFSLAVARLVSASCQELAIESWRQPGEWGTPFICPYSPDDVMSLDLPLTEKDCGQPKLDLFQWATWIYQLMTNEKQLCEYLNSKYGDLDAVGRTIRDGTFDDWPLLEREKLGSCLVKAWKGQYASASEALQDVRATLQACGRTLVSDVDDEIAGFDWAAQFNVAKHDDYVLEGLLKLSEATGQSASEQDGWPVLKR